MEITELALLVKNMRDAQKAYFKTRDHGNLTQSKDWERRVDKAIDEIINPKTPGLFEG